SVRQPLPLGGAVLERRAEAFEQLGESLAGGFVDGTVEVGEAYGEEADAFGAVPTSDPDDRAAFAVVGGFDRDRARQVAARALERAAGRVEKPPVLGARVLRGGPSVLGGDVLVRHPV